MTGNVTRHRMHTPDLLKGMAVLFMVQVHIMELFAQEAVLAGPAGTIALFLGAVPAAPVFMAVMGYFIGYRRKEPCFLARRGMRLLLAGMLLNLGLNAHLIFNVLFRGWGATVNIWHYVFGADILHLAGLSLIIMSLFLRVFRGRILPWLVILAVVMILPAVLPPHAGGETPLAYVMAFVHSRAEWSYFPLLPWLAYPLAGYLFLLLEGRLMQHLDAPRPRVLLMAILTVALGLTSRHAAGIMRDLPAYYHHGPGFTLWALAFTAWWTVLLGYAEKHAGETALARYIKWLGMHVTTVYIFQWLLIGNIATAVYGSMSLRACAVWFAVILIFTSLLTLTWNKLRKEYPIRTITS